MKYALDFLLKERELEFKLTDTKGSLKDNFSFSYGYDLDKLLLPALDKFLKKFNIKITDVESFKLKSLLDENSTSFRIAKSTVEALNLTKSL